MRETGDTHPGRGSWPKTERNNITNYQVSERLHGYGGPEFSHNYLIDYLRNYTIGFIIHYTIITS